MKRSSKKLKDCFKDFFVLFFCFFKIGIISFGGGYAMLGIIEAELVEKRRWISRAELADIFAIAESTPGPIAINTATFIGTKRLGILGGIVATLGVVLPSFAIISLLSLALDVVKDNKWVTFLFKGIRIGVLALILRAVLSFFADIKKTLFSFALMLTSFLLVLLVKVDVIYIILGTILLMSLTVAISSCVYKRRYFISGTPEYFSALVGKPLEKDEYYSQKALDEGKIKLKTSDLAKYRSSDNKGGGV